MEQVEQIFCYMYTTSNTAVRYHAFDMIVNVHSDTLYLSTGCGRRRKEGSFFLESLPRKGTPIKIKGNIVITCAIFKLVTASTTEGEVVVLHMTM